MKNDTFLYKLKDDNDTYGYLETEAKPEIVESAIIRVKRRNRFYTTDDLADSLRNLGYYSVLRDIIDMHY